MGFSLWNRALDAAVRQEISPDWVATLSFAQTFQSALTSARS